MTPSSETKAVTIRVRILVLLCVGVFLGPTTNGEHRIRHFSRTFFEMTRSRSPERHIEGGIVALADLDGPASAVGRDVTGFALARELDVPRCVRVGGLAGMHSHGSSLGGWGDPPHFEDTPATAALLVSLLLVSLLLVAR